MITPRLVVTFVFLAAVLAAAVALHDPGQIPSAPRAILPAAAALPGSPVPESVDDTSGAVRSPRQRWATRAVARVDRLTRGFPARLLGPAPGSRVLTNSVADVLGTQQVEMVATTRATAVTVLRHYRAVLGGVGFQEQPTDPVAGSLVVTFLRGADTVVVAAAAEHSTTYSVSASLHPWVVP